MIHKKVKHKPVHVTSLNMDRNGEICDLELFFLVIQELLQDQIKNGRKGKKLTPEIKMSYKKAQGVLWDLHSYFGLKGCFSFGTCDTCTKFQNGMTTSGTIGQCKGQERFWCDTCREHSTEGGGFGLCDTQ